MKDTLKIDLFFIQLICLPLYKKSCRFIQKLVCFSSTWFVSPFQIIMQSRIPLIEKLVCFLSNWFAYSLTIIMQSIYLLAFIEKLVCFSSNQFVCPFPIIKQSSVAVIYKLVYFSSKMKDALKISLFFIQLICLLLKKSQSGVVVENLFRNWFVFHLNCLFDLFQLSDRTEQSNIYSEIDSLFILLVCLQIHNLNVYSIYIKSGLFFI